MDIPLALLVADTDRTQEYVFESSRLPEIRGASRMLDDLNTWAGEMIHRSGGKVIISAGGMLLALVPESDAGALARKIETQYPQQTGSATITVAWRPIKDDFLSKGYPPSGHPFGSLMSWANTWLRRKKDMRDKRPWLDVLPFAERCSSCQVRAATVPASLPDRPLCSICSEKSKYTGLKNSTQGSLNAGRDHWFDQFQKFLSDNPDQLKSYYGNNTPFPSIKPDGSNFHIPHDLGEIGQACRSRSGYIGYIYLDGDEMGRVFTDMNTADQVNALSKVIFDSGRNAVFWSIAELIHPASIEPSKSREGTSDDLRDEKLLNGRLEIHPFDIITIGGDDIILIVPADVAIPLACKISAVFQNLIEKAYQEEPIRSAFGNNPGKKKPSTLSGGVVIADDHNPVRALQELAKMLKSSAKSSRYKNQQSGGPQEGYIDYIILAGTDMPDRNIAQSRQLYPYTIQQSVNHLRPLSLLGRPYSISKLTDAWQELVKLKKTGFAKSQMALLSQELYKGVQLSGLFFAYQKERGEKEQYHHLERAISKLQGTENPDLWKVFPDHPSTRFSAQTVLWDITELYDIV